MPLIGNLLMGAGIVPVTVTWASSAKSTSALTTYTFSSLSIGTASSDRKIIVNVHAEANGAGTALSVSSLTVDGISATLLVAFPTTDGSDRVAQEVWIASVPTGTTGNVVVTMAAGITRCGVGVFATTGASSTASATYTSTADPLSVSASCQSGGAIIGGAVAQGGSTSFTWAGITERYDEVVGGATYQSGASLAFTAAQSGLTVSATGSGTLPLSVLAVVALKPA